MISIDFSASTPSIQSQIDGVLERLRNSGKVRLNLGCGDHSISGVINCDLYNPLADMQAELASLPQFADASVDYIETHHAIEHLALSEVTVAIREWARVLRSGGYLAISCPNLEMVVQRWLNSDRQFGSYELRMIYGSQEHPGMFHKSGFCTQSLRRLLESNKFRIHFDYSPYPCRTTPSLFVLAERL